MTRPHLLYTAWSFPPSRAGGVYRALATVNAFAENGWDVTVLTVPRDVFETSTGIDPSLEEKVAPGVRIERVDPGATAHRNDLRQWSRFRARNIELWRGVDRLRDLRRFPELTYGRWRTELERAAAGVHAVKRVDLAIGTANPNVDFATGSFLFRRFGVPYVMDYRDAWALDVFSGERQGSWIPGRERVERRLLSHAAEVWFVNEPIRAWHARTFGGADRMHVVANGYDEYEIPLAVPVRPQRSEGLIFGYIGTLSDQVPVQPLIRAWRLARERGAIANTDQLVIHGYVGHSGTGAAADALAEAAADNVVFRGPVTKSRIGEIYAGFDALVLALGTGLYVTSGKVYEYAATGIPIVSVHDPRNAATEVVRESPGWVGTRSLAPADIADALAEVAQIAATQTDEERSQAQRWGSQYARRAQLQPRIAALRRLVEGDR
ncbi:glycosyltransferase [Microbacterium sp. ARD32]|uniref:glycosyltransferase n=1 Tax=Microbacterium sp. ARD32 TaxID=2962577 RepID=UPI002881D9FC|nr:glycosyltransferase [Microbacterium sp. ARD32]MDT0156756.1 glycosyltransferase [Microbacterium sp. ARD32]